MTLVGGEPRALLAASSAMAGMSRRTDDVANRLVVALGPAATTVAALAPFAPLRAAEVARALAAVAASPQAGLGTVGATLHLASLQMREAGHALEAAGAVGLVATGGLGLLRGERPTVLPSADGVDLHRETMTGSWSVGPEGHSSSVAVREVRRPDGTTFFVVELVTGDKVAQGGGVQVNGFGAFAEAAVGQETTRRWAVPTRRDAELLVAAVSASLVPVVGGVALTRLPRPTETSVAVVGSATRTGPIGLIPMSSAGGTAGLRHEVTVRADGRSRFATTASASGQASLFGTGGTGGAGSTTVAVDRSPTGVVNRLTVTTTTEVDRGRHGNPAAEALNREGTLVEREVQVEVTDERRAAGERIAEAVARGEEPDPADLEAVTGGPRVQVTSRTYDTRHQALTADVALPGKIGVGGAATIDTADLSPAEGPP